MKYIHYNGSIKPLKSHKQGDRYFCEVHDDEAAALRAAIDWQAATMARAKGARRALKDRLNAL